MPDETRQPLVDRIRSAYADGVVILHPSDDWADAIAIAREHDRNDVAFARTMSTGISDEEQAAELQPAVDQIRKLIDSGLIPGGGEDPGA